MAPDRMISQKGIYLPSVPLSTYTFTVSLTTNAGAETKTFTFEILEKDPCQFAKFSFPLILDTKIKKVRFHNVTIDAAGTTTEALCPINRYSIR